jgi:hypothetical protein
VYFMSEEDGASFHHSSADRSSNRFTVDINWCCPRVFPRYILKKLSTQVKKVPPPPPPHHFSNGQPLICPVVWALNCYNCKTKKKEQQKHNWPQVRNNLCIFPCVGVARVLSELPRQQIEEGMKQVCLQQVQLLAQLLRGQNGSHSEPIMYLDRIATIFR